MNIAVKELAALNMPDACPRCFYLKHAGVPWQIFPGIFSSIAKYSEECLLAMGDSSPIGPAVIEKAPHWSKFQATVCGVTLRGSPDWVVRRTGPEIWDNKTGMASGDRLLPLYEAQLNGYAYIWEYLHDERVSRLGLCYWEPQTDGASERVRPPDFFMKFQPKLVEVPVRQDGLSQGLIPDLLARAKTILSGKCPPSTGQCKDCAKLDVILQLIKDAEITNDAVS